MVVLSPLARVFQNRLAPLDPSQSFILGLRPKPRRSDQLLLKAFPLGLR